MKDSIVYQNTQNWHSDLKYNQTRWVLSSVWHTLTYHALLRYLQCVSMLSAILMVPSADSGSKMTE